MTKLTPDHAEQVAVELARRWVGITGQQAPPDMSGLVELVEFVAQRMPADTSNSPTQNEGAPA